MSQLEFTYTQNYLRSLADKILNRSLKLGATSAQIELNESIETSVDILNGEIENFATSYDSSIGICVFIGHTRGYVSISQVPPQDIDNILNQALDIAKYTQIDIHNGLADKEMLCTGFDDKLQLYNPIDLTNAELIAKTKELEKIGISLDKAINTSDGANYSLGKYNFVLANTNGFNLGYQTTRYNNSISLIGNTSQGMQTDYWYSSARDFNDLESNVFLAETAVDRVSRRLKKGSIATGIYDVIFEANIAKSLIGVLLSALNGNSLYRNLSFLGDSIGKQIFPNWLTITENPSLIKGFSSCYFDNEGVQVKTRNLVDKGVIQSYILSSYSARKLGMKTTGNAGGSHNIIVGSNFSGNISQLAQQMGTGLIVIETIGHGVNMVSGDYSVGASALWVDDGKIKYFVDGLTISGNLIQMYSNIQYISDDCGNSSIRCGSILLKQVTISV